MYALRLFLYNIITASGMIPSLVTQIISTSLSLSNYLIALLKANPPNYLAEF